MENEFWSFQHVQIPDCHNPVRFVQRRWIFVVCRAADFRVLKQRQTTLLFCPKSHERVRRARTLGDQSTSVMDRFLP